MFKHRIATILLRGGLTSTALIFILIGSAPLLRAKSQKFPKDQKFIFLLPNGFRGWVCVDFGIEGAPPLPREGDALVIRPRGRQVLQTSDKAAPWTLRGEAWFEVNGKRKPLPNDVTLGAGVSRSGPTEPSERGCAFVGTEDERDATDPPPGFENISGRRIVIPPQERQALEALYKSTDGDLWKHRAGWLGAAGTECNWHGVGCEGSDQSGNVVDLNLFDNNLSGSLPIEVGQLTRLRNLNLAQNHLVGALPGSSDSYRNSLH